MKSTDQFKQTIKAHLDKRAGEDALFAALDIGKPVNARVVVNHTIELTEAEKEQAREAAIKQHKEEVLEAMKKKAAKPVRKREEQKVEQASLFD